MNVDKTKEYVHVQATSKDGVSDAYLFSAGTVKTDTTDQFFVPAVNWLRADEKGRFKPYPNHWHFTATSDKQRCIVSQRLCIRMPKTRMRKPDRLPPKG